MVVRIIITFYDLLEIKDNKKKSKGLTLCIQKSNYFDIRRPDFEEIGLNIEGADT